MHDALSVFLGEWHAVGMSFGGTDKSGPDLRANGVPWVSTHSARWHTGEFFLIQDERAELEGKPFDTLSIMGVEPKGGLFARTFDNNGYYRHYTLAVEDRIWQLTGKTERATMIFSPDGSTQTIAWEWLRDGRWLQLCDRVATRNDNALPAKEKT
jgi:hypothetical protein